MTSNLSCSSNRQHTISQQLPWCKYSIKDRFMPNKYKSSSCKQKDILHSFVDTWYFSFTHFLLMQPLAQGKA